MLGVLERLRGLRGELVYRVEREELNPGALEDAVASDLRAEPFHDALGAAVTVVEGLRDGVPVVVQEHVVHAPGIARHPMDGFAPEQLAGQIDPVVHFVREGVEAPPQRLAFADGNVFETMSLGDIQCPVK